MTPPLGIPLDPDSIGPVRPKRGPQVPRPGPPPAGPVTPQPDRTDGRGLIVAMSRIEGLTAGRILQRPLYFQCPPTDELGPQFSWVWNDTPTIGDGVHSVANYKQLVTVTFNTLVVDEVEVHRIGNQYIKGPRYAVAPLTVEDHDDDPIGFVNYLRDIGNSMTPFALQYGQPRLWGKWDFIMAATLRDLRPVEREGELDARYLSLTFTEFPDAPRQLARPAPKPPGAGHKTGGRTKNGQRILVRLNSAHLPDSMNTLAEIAKHYYHSSSRWRLIAKASGGLPGIGPSTDLRTTLGRKKPPTMIVVPALPKAGR